VTCTVDALSPADAGLSMELDPRSNSWLSSMAHRGGRIIDTDLRISRALHVSNDSQEREQGSQDDPNVKAHQSFLV
jgi:hypothetical protein